MSLPVTRKILTFPSLDQTSDRILLDSRSLTCLVLEFLLERIWNSTCADLNYLTPWCWERLRAGGEGDDGGWDGWMASPTRWTWVWVDSGSWWWTGRPGVLQFMGLQRVGHDWATELNSTIVRSAVCKCWVAIGKVTSAPVKLAV